MNLSFTEKMNENGLEIYFKYDSLNINTILRLFGYLEQIHKIVLNTTSPVYYSEKTQQKFRNILELSDINTGNSIKIRLSEKWKLELNTVKGDLELVLPRKLGIAAIITFFILVAAKESVGFYKDYLDTELKKIEIELKQNELFKQMEDRKRTEPEFRSVIRQSSQVINYIMDNHDIIYFEINGIPLKEIGK